MNKIYEYFSAYRAKLELCAPAEPVALADKTISKTGLREVMQSKAALCIYILYMAIISVAFNHHEPWRDEFQSWGQALKMSSLGSFFVVPGEGHPPLFYWFLRIVQIFFGFEQGRYVMLALGFINGLLITVGLRKNPVLLFMFLFSYPFVYFWAIFLRSYTLGVLFILVAVAFFQKRQIVLCAIALWLASFTHFYFFFVIPIFVFEEFRQRRTIWLPSLLALPCLASLYVIYLSGSGNTGGQLDPERLSMYWNYFNNSFMLGFFGELGAITAVPMLICLFCLFKNFWFGAAVNFCILSFTLFCSFVYGGSYHHSGFVLLMILTAYLIHTEPLREKLLVGMMILCVASGLIHIAFDITNRYSNGTELYPAIKAEGLDHYKIFVLEDEIFTPSAQTHAIKYISLPMGMETDGIVDWSNHIHSIERYRQTYAQAGSPKTFVLVTKEYIEVKQKETNQPLQVDYICTQMKWNCELVTTVDGAFWDNARIFKVTAQ